jgi:hypothetical protein
MSQAPVTTVATVKTTRAARRAPVKALAQSVEQVATAAAADKARKAASRAALKIAKIAKIAEAARAVEAAAPVVPVVTVDHTAEYAANALQAATIDAAALGVPVEQVLADMGLATDGTPLASAADKDGYSGPMLALKAARKAYVKGANGNQHCGDDIAQLFAGVTPIVTIRACIAALDLPGNPYLHLNIGQQSMNLRNKLRGAIKKGTVKLSDAVNAVSTAMTAIV